MFASRSSVQGTGIQLIHLLDVLRHHCLQPCFAVMESGGCQWKVTADDVIYHNKIRGVHVNDVLQFNKVLLLGTQSETTIGRPFVPGATVVAAVEETFKDAKASVVDRW